MAGSPGSPLPCQQVVRIWLTLLWGTGCAVRLINRHLYPPIVDFLLDLSEGSWHGGIGPRLASAPQVSSAWLITTVEANWSKCRKIFHPRYNGPNQFLRGMG